jgi:hypothetical protein
MKLGTRAAGLVSTFVLVLFGAVVYAFIAMVFGIGDLCAATKVNNFNYVYVTTPIVYHDPDSTIVFLPGELMHIAAVQGAISQPAAGTIGLYITKIGSPCRDPTTHAPNGTAVFDQTTTPRTVFDVSGVAGKVTALPLSKVQGALALAPGNMICIIDETQVDMTVRANLTLSLGP